MASYVLEWSRSARAFTWTRRRLAKRRLPIAGDNLCRAQRPARCAPRSQGRCNRAVASSQLAEACTRTPPRQIKRITTLPRCSPVVWPCGLIGQKMHDAIAERALQHLSGPTRPWRAPGTHVEAGGSSPGGHVGGAVSHSILEYNRRAAALHALILPCRVGRTQRRRP